MLNCWAKPWYSTSILKALPGKLGIIRREPGILYISYLQTNDCDAIIYFCVDSMSLRSALAC